jgi:hypothetical protein
MHTTYAAAYAAHYPRYTALWSTRSIGACLGAREDIYATLRAQGDERTPYTGKLYAELDAIRDRELDLANRRNRRS